MSMACAIVPISSRRPTSGTAAAVSPSASRWVTSVSFRIGRVMRRPSQEGEREGQHGHGADHPGGIHALAQVAASTSSR